MFSRFRETRRWCQTGALAGASAGLAFVVFRDGDASAFLVVPTAFGVLGLAAGFVVATLYVGLRRRGVRSVAKEAIRSAGASLLVVPVLRLAGWGTPLSFAAELAACAAFLALTGAYFAAAEVWMPDGAARPDPSFTGR